MVQLSNISCISTETLSKLPYPIGAFVIILAGFLAWNYNHGITVLACLVGAVWIYSVYVKNNNRQRIHYLNLYLNSGNVLSIQISDVNFLNKVLKVLETIVMDGGIGNQIISINIENSKFCGNAKVLNDLGIKG
jgi:hypothetical protein